MKIMTLNFIGVENLPMFSVLDVVEETETHYHCRIPTEDRLEIIPIEKSDAEKVMSHTELLMALANRMTTKASILDMLGAALHANILTREQVDRICNAVGLEF